MESAGLANACLMLTSSAVRGSPGALWIFGFYELCTLRFFSARVWAEWAGLLMLRRAHSLVLATGTGKGGRDAGLAGRRLAESTHNVVHLRGSLSLVWVELSPKASLCTPRIHFQDDPVIPPRSPLCFKGADAEISCSRRPQLICPQSGPETANRLVGARCTWANAQQFCAHLL